MHGSMGIKFIAGMARACRALSAAPILSPYHLFPYSLSMSHSRSTHSQSLSTAIAAKPPFSLSQTHTPSLYPIHLPFSPYLSIFNLPESHRLLGILTRFRTLKPLKSKFWKLIWTFRREKIVAGGCRFRVCD